MLILEKVTKYFNKGTINQVHALKELDLIVERSDFLTVIGSNGAGKSTMLNCVAGG
ncbi:MAG: ATP-binding cassette domain-containing protein, partial [Oceanidesulfovibrio sp.]